jgi:hypothetical protein
LITWPRSLIRFQGAVAAGHRDSLVNITDGEVDVDTLAALTATVKSSVTAIRTRGLPAQ